MRFICPILCKTAAVAAAAAAVAAAAAAAAGSLLCGIFLPLFNSSSSFLFIFDFDSLFVIAQGIVRHDGILGSVASRH